MNTQVKRENYEPDTLERNQELSLALQRSPLFAGLTVQDMEGCLSCSNSVLYHYDKGDMIFYMDDVPRNVLVLIDGSVSVGRDTPDGKRIYLQTCDAPGDLFGEVYLFLGQVHYEHFAVAEKNSQVLSIPKEYLFSTACGGKFCTRHARLIENFLSILARKADDLDRRLTILSSNSLREKIARVLIQNDETHPGAPYCETRENMAREISATRPSVSRELMAMKSDGLIDVTRKGITLRDRNALYSLENL
ncbi:MAG: Crp/Fnr family transcriptional regulator [Lachnospiraceae bacterium]